MRLDSTSGTLSPFEAARAMSIADASPGEPGYWSGQMQAVARRRDQTCFMRIYDHFAPRVRLYLRGLGVRDAVARIGTYQRQGYRWVVEQLLPRLDADQRHV